ncbi:MAG: S1/P1 nuclease [Betaproteobacteria bacterium]|nr:S1/P1 nuclease [Betaproteobacteria bacterium]
MKANELRRGRFRLAAFCAALLLAPPAMAWNAAGHRIIATIAWEQSDAQTRDAVDALLSQHPDAGRWNRKGADSDHSSASSLWLAASTWPDEIRQDSRFYDPDEKPTPQQPGFPDMLRHRDWHYADRPDNGNCPPGGQLESQWPVLAEMARDAKQDPARRALALSWAIHLLGDAHQPLHAGTRCDRGGNLLLLATPSHPRFGQMSLHAFWDDLPGPPWLSGTALEETAQRWQREIPPPAPGATVRKWLEESRTLARERVYEGIDEEISAAVQERAAALARQRIVYAGYRLAEWLRVITEGKSRAAKASD